MEFSFSEIRFKKLLNQKDLFLKLLVGSLILNGLQLIERMRVCDKVILVPPSLSKEVWIEGSFVSPSFIEEWALYLSSVLLNMTPETADFNHSVLLKYVAPESASLLQKKFSSDLKNFKENRIATVFKPKSVEINQTGSLSKAHIVGTLSTYVGSKRIEEVDKKYTLTFKTSKSVPHLSLLSFEEGGVDDTNETKQNQAKNQDQTEEQGQE